MIIDLIEAMSNEDRVYFENAYERYHLYAFHSPPNSDLYKEYPSAPYNGEGVCVHGICDNCEHNEPDEHCEEYEDVAYHEWFEQFEDQDTRPYIKNLLQKDHEILTQFLHSEEWRMVVYPSGTYIIITADMLQWCNDNNVEYCIHRRLGGETNFFLKCKKFPTVFRAKFTPRDIHVGDLIELKENDWTTFTVTKKYDKVKKWVMDNIAEHTFVLSGDVLIFENKEDAIHYKMIWV